MENTTIIYPSVHPETDIKPKRGGIIKDSIENDTPFTGKGRSITLPDDMDGLCAASLWVMYLPGDSKFQIF